MEISNHHIILKTWIKLRFQWTRRCIYNTRCEAWCTTKWHNMTLCLDNVLIMKISLWRRMINQKSHSTPWCFCYLLPFWIHKMDEQISRTIILKASISISLQWLPEFRKIHSPKHNYNVGFRPKYKCDTTSSTEMSKMWHARLVG